MDYNSVGETNIGEPCILPDLLESQLMNLLRIYDNQTVNAVRLVSLANTNPNQQLPEIEATIQTLILLMSREIGYFKNQAKEFTNLTNTFRFIVNKTKHNMNMALPSAESIFLHLQVICQALNHDSNEDLNDENRNDIEIALSEISGGKLLY